MHADLLSALPPELSVHVAGYLTLADAHALAGTCRDTPVAASAVLEPERRALRIILDDAAWGADAADLLRRVGTGRLCRAWGLSEARPYAALCAHLGRRLGRQDDGAAALPFALATFDAPGSVGIVLGSGWWDTEAPMLAAAAAAAAHRAGGPRVLTFRPKRMASGRRWYAMGDVDVGSPLYLYEKRQGITRPVFVIDASQIYVPDHSAAMSWLATPHMHDFGSVMGVYTSQMALCLMGGCVGRLREARFVAISRAGSSAVGAEWLLAQYFGAPPDDKDGRAALLLCLRTLAPDEWLVLDGWRRRWCRWTPPPVAGGR